MKIFIGEHYNVDTNVLHSANDDFIIGRFHSQGSFWQRDYSDQLCCLVHPRCQARMCGAHLSCAHLYPTSMDLHFAQILLNKSQILNILFLDCCNSSEVVSRTLSIISSRSPFVNVMGSNGGLVAFVLFRDPSFCCYLYLFTWNGVLSPSLPPSPCANCSSSSVSGKGDLQLRSNAIFLQSGLLLGLLPLLRDQILHYMLPCILTLLLCWIPCTFEGTSGQVGQRVPIYWPALDDFLNRIVSGEIWKIEPLLLWVLLHSNINAVEVCLEFCIHWELFIHCWRELRVLVNIHLNARLHQNPGNFCFCDPHGVLCGPKGWKLCSL